MSYQRERDNFIACVTREGLPLHVALTLLREATGFQRRAELSCSSEDADRDRVPCPASRIDGRRRLPTIDGIAPCLCDCSDGQHTRIPRITLQDWHAEQRVRKLLATCEVTRLPQNADSVCWQMLTAGDPRGYTLRVIPPSYAERNKDRDAHNVDSIGVPSGPTRLRF